LPRIDRAGGIAGPANELEDFARNSLRFRRAQRPRSRCAMPIFLANQLSNIKSNRRAENGRIVARILNETPRNVTDEIY
jgi:hypothetical protein